MSFSHLHRLRTLDVAQRTFRDNDKGDSRKTEKGRADRAEATVINRVRASCVARDGFCAVTRFHIWSDDRAKLQMTECNGKSEWAHMHARRRSKTVGMDPEYRHTTTHSLMLCTLHHLQYDNKTKPRLYITALSSAKGADGGLKMRHGK